MYRTGQVQQYYSLQLFRRDIASILECGSRYILATGWKRCLQKAISLLHMLIEWYQEQYQETNEISDSILRYLPRYVANQSPTTCTFRLIVKYLVVSDNLVALLLTTMDTFVQRHSKLYCLLDFLRGYFQICDSH